MDVTIDGVTTKISDEVLSTIKENLHRQALSWKTSVTQGGLANLKGEYVDQGTACHSWVSSAFSGSVYIKPKNNGTFFVATASTEKRSKNVCNPESLNALKAWLISESSPFAKYIVNRDDSKSLADGFIILCGKGGASYIETLWICKVLRYGVEGDKALDVWKVLYDGGVNPVLAIAICSEIRTVYGATFGYSGADYHSCVFGFRGPISLEDIIRGKVNKNVDETYKLFIDKGAILPLRDFQRKVKGFCFSRKVSDGWGGFVQSQGAKKEEFLANVLAWQKELEKNVPKEELWDYGNAVGPLVSPAPTPSLPTASTVYLDVDL